MLYLYIFLLALIIIIAGLLTTIKYKTNIPKKIFTFWDTEELPHIVKKCINTWRYHNPTYEIIILNSNNLDKYITNGSKLLSLKRASDFKARLSDYVRIHALAEHGGVWMDASIICYGSLDDLFYNNNKSYKTMDYFGYYIPNFTTNYNYPIIENWFFAAPTNSIFLKLWRDEFMKCNDYDHVREYIQKIIDDGIDLQNLSSPEYLTMHAAAQVVLQTKYDSKKNNQILLDATAGPFKYLSENDWDIERSVTALCNDSKFRTPIVKLRGSDREFIEKNNLEKYLFI
jgi:hypothetical protein